MGCAIPGCGSSGHNRRTHDKHVPPGEALIEQDQHECEPAPDQVYYCRHCGGDLMVPLAGAPEPVILDTSEPRTTGSGLDEFAPVLVEAVSRIGDEMVTPHGPGCTLADPCDECRRHVAGVDRAIDEHLTPERLEWLAEIMAAEGADRIDPLPIPPWRTVLGPDEPIRITLPGVYELTSEQYHSFDVTGDWFSNSDAKKLLQTCPAQFDYDRRNGVKKISDAFDFGHVAHAVVLGDGERYEVFEPKRIDRRTKEGQAQQKAVDEARAAGRTPIYGDQFALIEAMAEAIKADPIPHELLTQPGRPEVCLFWHEQIKVTDPHNTLYGQTVQVKRRAMIDHLPDLTEDGKAVRIVDYKTADEVKPDDSLRKKVYDYGYHRQSATYEAAVECLFGRSADVVFLLQSKKPPHLIVPVELDTPAVRVAAAENRQAMEIWSECVATGEWPGYTKGVETSGVPAWIERQYDDEIGDIS